MKALVRPYAKRHRCTVQGGQTLRTEYIHRKCAYYDGMERDGAVSRSCTDLVDVMDTHGDGEGCYPDVDLVRRMLADLFKAVREYLDTTPDPPTTGGSPLLDPESREGETPFVPCMHAVALILERLACRAWPSPRRWGWLILVCQDHPCGEPSGIRHLAARVRALSVGGVDKLLAPRCFGRVCPSRSPTVLPPRLNLMELYVYSLDYIRKRFVTVHSDDLDVQQAQRAIEDARFESAKGKAHFAERLPSVYPKTFIITAEQLAKMNYLVRLYLGNAACTRTHFRSLYVVELGRFMDMCEYLTCTHCDVLPGSRPSERVCPRDAAVAPDEMLQDVPEVTLEAMPDVPDMPGTMLVTVPETMPDMRDVPGTLMETMLVTVPDTMPETMPDMPEVIMRILCKRRKGVPYKSR